MHGIGEIVASSPRTVPRGWQIVATCGPAFKDIWSDAECCLIARRDEPLTDEEASEFAQKLAGLWNSQANGKRP